MVCKVKRLQILQMLALCKIWATGHSWLCSLTIPADQHKPASIRVLGLYPATLASSPWSWQSCSGSHCKTCSGQQEFAVQYIQISQVASARSGGWSTLPLVALLPVQRLTTLGTVLHDLQSHMHSSVSQRDLTQRPGMMYA